MLPVDTKAGALRYWLLGEVFRREILEGHRLSRLGHLPFLLLASFSQQLPLPLLQLQALLSSPPHTLPGEVTPTEA